MALTVLGLDELVALLESRNKAEPIGIITRTYPELQTGGKRDKVTGLYANPYVRYDENKKKAKTIVAHLAERGVFIGADYESCVNRQRDRELQPIELDGSVEYFRAQDLWWGKGVPLNKFFATHADTGGIYLIYKPTQDADGYVKTKQELWIAPDGSFVDKELIKPWFKPIADNKSQGVDKAVAWRTLELSGLEQIKIGGDWFAVEIEETRDI